MFGTEIYHVVIDRDLTVTHAVSGGDSIELHAGDKIFVYKAYHNLEHVTQTLLESNVDEIKCPTMSNMYMVEIDNDAVLPVIVDEEQFKEIASRYHSKCVEEGKAIRNPYYIPTVYMSEPYKIYTMSFKNRIYRNVFRYVYDASVSDDILNMLTESKQVKAFYVDGVVASIQCDGHTRVLDTTISRHVVEAFFNVTGVGAITDKIYTDLKLQVIEDPVVEFNLTKLIAGCMVGDVPLTLDMLKSGFSAKIGAGGIYDIIIGGAIVTYGFENAVLLYHEWFNYLLMCDDLHTIKYSSEYAISNKSDPDDWTNMLDDLVDSRSLEVTIAERIEHLCRPHEVIDYFDYSVEPEVDLIRVKFSVVAYTKLSHVIG